MKPLPDIEGLPPPPLYRRRWFVISAALAVGAIFWLYLAMGKVFDARRDALAGVDRLEAVRGQVTVDTVSEGRLTIELQEAAALFASANRDTRSILVAPLRLVPWIGTQIRSADALSSSAAAVSEALAAAASDIAQLSEAAGQRDRVEVAREALAVTRRTRQVVTDADLGPDAGLAGALADARARFASELDDAGRLLADAEIAARGVVEFLAGPNRYLLLAANNSEMQAGSGSYLMAGTVDVRDGRIEVADLRPTSEILLPAGAVSISDPDLDARWGWLAIAEDWRNLSPSPRFPPNARLAAAMWAELRGEEVDGVIVLDPVALSAIMTGTGPIDIDGRIIDADGVVRELLFDQYWEDDVALRRDRLTDIASAALRTVDESETDLITLARALQDAAAGRHILVWSPHADQQAAWETVGIDGMLEADSLAVGLINRGANKLDTFLNIEASLTSESTDRGVAVSVRLDLTNRADPAFPSYVLGPAESLGNEIGTYVGILAVNLPATAGDVEFVGVGDLVASGSDGDGQVIAVWVEIPGGGTISRELRFTLPDAAGTLRIEPSARVPGIGWSAGGREWIDVAATVVDLATGSVTGEGIDRNAQPVVFEPDPLSNPVAPIPFMRVDGDIETTVIVGWDLPNAGDGIDVWERSGNGAWTQVAADVPDRQILLMDRIRLTEYCYRTALHPSPERFSATECITVPGALGYMRFFGDARDYFTAADFVGSGPLDIRVLVAPDDWTPEFWQMFAGQYDSQQNDRSWRFGIDVFTSLVGNFSEDGFADLGANRELPVSIGDGRRKWVRMTVEPDRGLLRFWTSNGGTVWRQLGDDRTFDPIDDLHDSTRPVFVGLDRPGSDNPFAGKLYYLEIRAGVNGEVIANLDFRTADQQQGDAWVDGAGNRFEAHGSGWEYVPPGE